jgi:hypothetical protein
VGREREGDEEEREADMTPYDILAKLPGITLDNIRSVVHKTSCIADLARMPKPDLVELLGTMNGTKLWKFLSADNGPLFL